MTITTDHAAQARARLDDEMATLPTVEQLAGPLLSTIYALHNLQDAITDAEFLDQRAAEQCASLVRLVEEVATLAESAINSCTPVHRPGALGRGADLTRIIFDLTGVDGLHGHRSWAIVLGESAA